MRQENPPPRKPQHIMAREANDERWVVVIGNKWKERLDREKIKSTRQIANLYSIGVSYEFSIIAKRLTRLKSRQQIHCVLPVVYTIYIYILNWNGVVVGGTNLWNGGVWIVLYMAKGWWQNFIVDVSWVLNFPRARRKDIFSYFECVNRALYAFVNGNSRMFKFVSILVHLW